MDPKIALFRSRFSGLAHAYGTWDLSTGRVRQVKCMVTDAVLQNHIAGIQPYGVYLLVDDRTRATVVDVDLPDLQPVIEFVAAARQYGLSAHVERSKSKGHHIWLMHPHSGVLAAKSRCVVMHILNEIGHADFEVFPKQDRLSHGITYGNFIFAPLFGGLVNRGRTVFLRANDLTLPCEDQWKLLAELELVRESQLDEIIAMNKLNDECPVVRHNVTSASLNRTAGLPRCAQRMLSEGVRQQQRVSCFRLAVALKLAGLPIDATLAVLRSWACRIRPINGRRLITPVEIDQQASCAYDPKYRSYGCEDPAVRTFCDARCPIRSRATAVLDVPVESCRPAPSPTNTRSPSMSAMPANRPIQEFRARNLSLAIWQNDGTRDGRPVTLHSITLNKRYQDQQSGEWKDSNSFFPDDLPRLRLLLGKAYEHLLLQETSTTNSAFAPKEHATAD